MSAFPAFEAPCCSSFVPQQRVFRRKTRLKYSKQRRILPEISEQSSWLGGENSPGWRIYAISDIHTDYRENMEWIRRLSTEVYERHSLIVAGDVSDNLETFRATMQQLKNKFMHVFFVPGNHDLWIRGAQHEHMNSLEKLQLINEICEDVGVETRPRKVDRVWIVPLLSWYHQSFDKERNITGYNIPSLEKTSIDYHACKWPEQLKTPEIALAQHFDELNTSQLTGIQNTDQVITFSHFLPRPELCPEKRMLFYPNLPKIIGSDLLEARLRGIHGSNGNSTACHVFGHTHFCWDTTVDGIRYLQAPLAYPRERKRRVNGGESWLPLCIFDSRAGKGLLPGPIPCYWSEFYRINKRNPENIVLAPWVADLYHPT